MTICQIRWIDDKGKPTPDTKPAVGKVRMSGRWYDSKDAPGGRVWIPTSEWYPICADHLVRLKTDLQICSSWEFVML